MARSGVTGPSVPPPVKRSFIGKKVKKSKSQKVKEGYLYFVFLSS
jgi:hypothetical protein